MRHVLWLGGAPGAGKTTVARRLVRRHGLRLYSADTRTWAHRRRALAAGSAAAARWEALTREERRVLPPDELVELWLHRERGPLVVEDLRALPAAPLVLAEGTTVPAAAVDDPARALWLVPAPAFRDAQLAARDVTPEERAGYALLAETIEAEARAHDVPVLVVDGSRGVAATAEAAERHFAAALAEGPHAATRDERRALLREANEAVVEQVRTGHAYVRARGDPDDVVRLFVCECGDRACVAEVEATVREAARAPVLTPDHA